MKDDSQLVELLRRTIDRLGKSSDYWSGLLDDYMMVNNLRESQLIDLLKCGERNLLKLFLCRLPRGVSGRTFLEDIESISEYTNIENELLLRIYREAEACRALLNVKGKSDSRGYLKAARSRRKNDNESSTSSDRLMDDSKGGKGNDK
jgi:hypothetical protein